MTLRGHYRMLSKNVLLNLTREEAETLAEYIFDLAEEHDDSKEDPAFDRLAEIHFKITKALEEDKDQGVHVLR